MKVWYSICSEHQEYEKTCRRCRVGSWVDEDDLLFEEKPVVWRTDRRILSLETRDEIL